MGIALAVEPCTYKVLLLVYKAFTSSKPSYLCNVLMFKKQMIATRSSLKVNLLDITKTCDNGYTAKAFAVAGYWTMSCADAKM